MNNYLITAYFATDFVGDYAFTAINECSAIMQFFDTLKEQGLDFLVYDFTIREIF